MRKIFASLLLILLVAPAVASAQTARYGSRCACYNRLAEGTCGNYVDSNLVKLIDYVIPTTGDAISETDWTRCRNLCASEGENLCIRYNTVKLKTYDCYCKQMPDCTQEIGPYPLESIDTGDAVTITNAVEASCRIKCSIDLDQCLEISRVVLSQEQGQVRAECPPGTPPGSRCLKNPIGVTTVAGLVGNIVKAMLGVLGSLALLMFIYGGFLWLTSGGSADKIGKGKDVMKWATIGLLMVFAAAAAVRFVLGAFTTL